MNMNNSCCWWMSCTLFCFLFSDVSVNGSHPGVFRRPLRWVYIFQLHQNWTIVALFLFSSISGFMDMMDSKNAHRWVTDSRCSSCVAQILRNGIFYVFIFVIYAFSLFIRIVIFSIICTNRKVVFVYRMCEWLSSRSSLFCDFNVVTAKKIQLYKLLDWIYLGDESV